MDLGTGLALFGSAKLAERLLGPTVDYLGEGIKAIAQKRLENVKNIFSAAARKLGKRINDEGSVPPKVLRGIIDEGSYNDDFLAVEYFGGILASSRSGIVRDDRGAYFVSLVNRLSCYQLRSHYILYYIVNQLYAGTSLDDIGFLHKEVYVPYGVYEPAMDFTKAENAKVLLQHAIDGLTKENLLRGVQTVTDGNEEHDSQRFFRIKINKPGFLFCPTSHGIEFFLWAHGKSEMSISSFFDRDERFELDHRINIEQGFKKTGRRWARLGESTIIPEEVMHNANE
jgi:hypothetical protein